MEQAEKALRDKIYTNSENGSSFNLQIFIKLYLISVIID